MQRSTLGFALALPVVLAACAAAPPPSPPAPDGGPVRASPAEQARMQAYIDGLYDRRYVRRTFKTATGDDVDCVDFDQQPSCRNGGCPHQPPAAPVPPGPPSGVAPGALMSAGPGMGPGGIVHLAPGPPPGTVVSGAVSPQPAPPPGPHSVTADAGPSCQEGTVPIVRLRIENLRRFRTLEDFFRK
jgi:hypothetical protein